MHAPLVAHASRFKRASGFSPFTWQKQKIIPVLQAVQNISPKILAIVALSNDAFGPASTFTRKKPTSKKISKEGRKRWREQSREKNLYGKKEKKMKRKKEGVKFTKILVNFVRSGVKSFSSRSGSIDFEPRMFFRPSLSLSQQVHMMLLTKKKDKWKLQAMICNFKTNPVNRYFILAEIRARTTKKI